MPPSQLQGGGRKAADLSAESSTATGRLFQPVGTFPPKIQQLPAGMRAGGRGAAYD
jgi:hypothetical protein